MKKILRIPLYFLILLFIFLEDIVWKGIAEPINNKLKEFNFFQKLESYLIKMPVVFVLGLFLALLALEEWMAIIAVGLIAKGGLISGVLLYISRIPLVSVVFFIFNSSKENFLKYQWFAIPYMKIIAIIDWIKNTQVYVNTINFYHRFKERKRSFVSKFFKRAYDKTKQGV